MFKINKVFAFDGLEFVAKFNQLVLVVPALGLFFLVLGGNSSVVALP